MKLQNSQKLNVLHKLIALIVISIKQFGEQLVFVNIHVLIEVSDTYIFHLISYTVMHILIHYTKSTAII